MTNLFSNCATVFQFGACLKTGRADRLDQALIHGKKDNGE